MAKVYEDLIAENRCVKGKNNRTYRMKYMDTSKYSVLGAPLLVDGVADTTMPTKLTSKVDLYIRRGYSGGVTRSMNTS